ncbi:MAG: ABC transporter permease, partial [Acidobacteria bacterium]|nr:ABC transporter permease [Acidobacteriota bacterium]
MLERIRRMLVKEFIQVFRDPRMRPVIFAMPIIQLLVFSFAVTTDVENIATAIYDEDQTVASRELVSRFVNSRYFSETGVIDSADEIRALLDEGQVQAVFRLPHGFESALLTGDTAPVQVLVDGTNSNTASVVLSYGQEIIRRYTLDRLQRELAPGRRPGITPEPVRLEVRAWFNENLESRNFFVPGVIALIVTILVMILTSMAIVREKEVGTMEQILVTPIRPLEFIIGKTIPFAAIGFFDMFLVLTVGILAFRIPFRGSFLLLVAGTAIYLLTILGLGLFISTISRTQQQAMLSLFFFILPAVLLSGFMFPIANMPVVVQWLT